MWRGVFSKWHVCFLRVRVKVSTIIKMLFIICLGSVGTALVKKPVVREFDPYIWQE